MTEEETMEWLNWKYSNKVATVLRLTSGRVVVAAPGLHLFRLCSEESAIRENSELYAAVSDVATTPLPEYEPPALRAERHFAYSEADLTAILNDDVTPDDFKLMI